MRRSVRAKKVRLAQRKFRPAQRKFRPAQRKFGLPKESFGLPNKVSNCANKVEGILKFPNSPPKLGGEFAGVLYGVDLLRTSGEPLRSCRSYQIGVLDADA